MSILPANVSSMCPEYSSQLITAPATSLLLMSSTGKQTKIQQRDESKDGGQQEREEQVTADSRKVIFAERSDSLRGPNWIHVIINMLC